METTLEKLGLTVWFGQSEQDLSLLSSPCILIYPTSSNWNDFKLRTNCRFITKITNETQYTGELHTAFLGGEHELSALVSNKINQRFHPVNSKSLPQFFTLLMNMQGYRNLVQDFGVAGAKDILLSMNDLVALRNFGKAPQWYEEAITSPAFTLSFVRSSEVFFAFHNAGSILDGLSEELLGDVSNQLDLVFKLGGFENQHKFEFRFETRGILPKRINVIIGKNGVGKSQALSQLVRAALKGDDSLTDPVSGRPMINRLLAIATPGETHYTFQAEPRGVSRIKYRRLLLTRNSRSSRSRGIGELLVQLVRSEESIGENSRWELFLETLEAALPLNEIAIPLRKGSVIAMPLIISSGQTDFVPLLAIQKRSEQLSLTLWGAIDPRSDPVRIVNGVHYPLSSGQLAFFRFALQATLFIENGTLVLLDEPETHLHPNLISQFVGLLDKILELTGSIAIIATHSAYFVREMPRSQVFVVRENDNHMIEIGNPRLKTLGADVGAISFFVFEDDISGSIVENLKRKMTKNTTNKEKLLTELENELSSEAFMTLSRELGMD